jgi:RNA polymerase sigma factor (sigma-70 family)
MAFPPIQPDVDFSVIASAQAGDERAHAAIYGYYCNRLFTLIYRLVPRRAQADDLLQEVFVEVLRNVRSYNGSGSFGGWLHSIAVNKCLSYLRSPWRRSVMWLDDAATVELEESQLSAPLDVEHARRTELEAALRKLSPLSRAVVWLHDVEGYTHAEIGRKLGRTVSFSKSQLARAHARLRELLVSHDETRLDTASETESGTTPCTPAT